MSQGNNFFGFVIVSTHMRPTVTLLKPKNLSSTRSNFLHGMNFLDNLPLHIRLRSNDQTAAQHGLAQDCFLNTNHSQEKHTTLK